MKTIAIEINNTLSDGTHFTAPNNDCGVREYDKHTYLSANGKLIVVVGNHLDGLLERRLLAQNYMAEDGNISDFVDDLDEEVNDDGDQYLGGSDTSSAQARKGKDMQAICWNRLNLTRERYRQRRLKQYVNFEDIPLSGDTADKRYKQTSKGGNYYEFFHNSRAVRPTIFHFQLRNLVWATSKHDVYVMSDFSLMHWSSVSEDSTEIIDFSGYVGPTGRHPGIRISTLAVKDDFLVAGGFRGELACKRFDKDGVTFCTTPAHDDDAITTAIEIYGPLSGGKHFMTSNNDGGVREYEMDGFQLVNYFQFPWPVNHISLSPDRKLMAVVGDHPDGLLAESTNGKSVATVEGHLDYSFASAWHPNGLIFATGNQDKTCRLWDIRNLATPVTVLKGNLGAVRSLRFSSDGQFLVVAEPADFVHVYNTKLNYELRQEIDFFGEISGISLSPDDETLYVGVSDLAFSSLLQFKKRHKYGYLDSFV